MLVELTLAATDDVDDELQPVAARATTMSTEKVASDRFTIRRS
jgi:hypothetical protein